MSAFIPSAGLYLRLRSKSMRGSGHIGVPEVPARHLLAYRGKAPPFVANAEKRPSPLQHRQPGTYPLADVRPVKG